MNEINKGKLIELSSNDYRSEYKKEGVSLENLLPLALPLVLVFSTSSSKGRKKKKNNSEINVPAAISPSRTGDLQVVNTMEETVSKLSNAVDLMKKVNRLNDIKKSTNGQSLEGIQEALPVIKSIFSDTANLEKLNSIESTLSTVKKLSEVKKILDAQRATSVKKSDNSSATDVMSAITPLLENRDNAQNLQKIVKMANLISALNK